MLRFRLAGAAALIALAASSQPRADGPDRPIRTAALAPAGSLGVAYTISFWGIPFGHTDFDSHFQQSLYSTRSHFETSGIVSVFWQARIDADSNGAIAPHSLIPALYDSFYQRGSDKTERVKVTFGEGEPQVDANPPYDLTKYRVTADEKKDALDPLSAVTLVLTGARADSQNPCGTVAPVFDGRRRYDIEFTYIKDEKPDVDPALWKGNAHLCRLRYHQIAGFKPKIMKEGEAFPPIYGWFVDVPNAAAPGGHYEVALRVWASTGWGTVDATLSRLRVNGGDSTSRG